MRVALDARVATDHFPGIGRVAVELAAALARELPPGDLLTLRMPGSAGSRFGPPAGLAVPCAASPFSLAQQWELPRRLAHARADVYHSLYVGMPWFPGRPTVWTCHDLIPLIVPGLLDPLRRAATEALHRVAARTARRIVAVSSATREDLVHRLGVERGRIDVVPWGVEARFLRAEPGAETPRERTPCPPGYFLYVGINKPHKNLPRVVRAVARAQAENPARDLRLVVAGPWDPRYPEARDLARASGMADRFQFLGPVADEALPDLYAGARAFVFASLYEGFGLPLLEALASGLPTITSDASSMPEIAGDAALLVPPADEAALADAIGRLADDRALRQELGARALRRAARFTWQETARRMIAIYARVAPARIPAR